MTDTALASALKAHGINPNENEFLCALAKFLNNGGTIFRARALVDAAERLSGEGQHVRATKGHISAADTGQTISAGHPPSAREGHGKVASANDRDGTAKPSMPDEGRHNVAVPAREPSKTDVQAMAMVKKQASKAVLDLGILSGNVPGGPAYLELRVRDLEGMIRRQFSEGAVHGHSGIALTMLFNEVGKIADVDPDMRVGDVLGKDVLKRLARRLEAESLKPMIGDALKLVGQFVNDTVKELPHA